VADSLADLGDMDDLMLPDDVDEVSTKLDLARAFIDMGDTEGARGSLEEVMSEGSAEQKDEAKTLLDQI
jgi:pilus assembly protein FimV